MPEFKLMPIELPPGVRSNGTEYQNKGRWVDANLVRFAKGTVREIGGWVARELGGATIDGVPTKMLAWTPEVIGVTQRPILAVGTTEGLFVVVDGIVSDITPADFAGDDSLVWSFDTFGSYLVATAWSAEDYTKSQGPFVWTGDPGTEAEPMEVDSTVVSPPSVTSLVTTEDRFLFALGGVDVNGPNYLNYPDAPSTRTVHWPTREKLLEWTAAETNSAGSFPLSTQGDLRCGLKVRGGVLLLTTTDAHLAQFVGGEYVYGFKQEGSECGVIAVNAAVATDVAAFWMGHDSFFYYDGFVKKLPCEVSDAVFAELNRAYAHRVWALHNAAFSEVTWFYPSGESTVPNRFVTYNYEEQHSTIGTLTRCAGVSRQLPGAVPVMIDADGVIWDHETGRVPEEEDVYLRTAPMELAEGDRIVHVLQVVPDEANVGDLQLTILARFTPTGDETAYGPYPHTAYTDVRATGRQISLLFERTAAGATHDWRLGTMRLGVAPGGRR